MNRLLGKDEDDYSDIVAVIGANFKILKDIFIYTAAGPDWPHITNLQMMAFCQNLNLVDGKIVNGEAI